MSLVHSGLQQDASDLTSTTSVDFTGSFTASQDWSGESGRGAGGGLISCTAVLLAADIVGLVLAFLIGWAVCPIDPAGILATFGRATAEPLIAQELLAVGVIGAGILIYLQRAGHYLHRYRISAWDEAQHVLSAGIAALAVCAFVRYALGAAAISNLTLVFCVLIPPCCVVCRSIAKQVLRATGLWRLRTVIVRDAGPAGDDEVREALLSDRSLGYEIVGDLSLAAATAAAASAPAGAPWRNMLRRFRAQLLIVVVDQTRDRANHMVISALTREAVPFAVIPRARPIFALGCDQLYFFGHDVSLLTARGRLTHPASSTAKAALDVLAAGTMLLLLSPLMLAVAVLIRRDGGPALFGHERIGVGGRRFRCLKFRSMVVNADQVLREHLAAHPEAAAEWEATQKLRDDPRITPVGRFLRNTSLDELPQLFNVIRQEMSLVGPRPVVQMEIDRYGEDAHFYLATRPGITGLWQVSGRSETSYERRVQLDAWYVKNWTLWHDIVILLKTIPAVLSRKGAY
jgi:undecaprenyl-phosphate galactose phosphotransferase